LVASLTDVAVIVTVSEALTFVGAAYWFVTPLALFACAMFPQEVTLAGQVTIQLTP
jgi:hypothetical protein